MVPLALAGRVVSERRTCPSRLFRLQANQLGMQRRQCLLQLEHTVLRARQIAAAALFFQGKCGFKRTVRAEGGDGTFQAMSGMLQSCGVAAGYRSLDFLEGDG